MGREGKKTRDWAPPPDPAARPPGRRRPRSEQGRADSEPLQESSRFKQTDMKVRPLTIMELGIKKTG